VANALAYYDTATITAVKSFIVQAPGVVVRNFVVINQNCPTSSGKLGPNNC
jgi:hypothetical protein